MKFSASGPAVCLAPGLWAYTAVFSRYTQNSGENRRIFLKDPDFLGIGEKSTVLCPKAPSIPCIGMCRINFHPWQPVCPSVHRLDLTDSCRSPHWRRRGAAHSIWPVSQLRTAFPCCKQEGSPIAGFSACGGTLLRHNSLPPHGDPRGAFFMSWDALSYDIEKSP